MATSGLSPVTGSMTPSWAATSSPARCARTGHGGIDSQVGADRHVVFGFGDGLEHVIGRAGDGTGPAPMATSGSAPRLTGSMTSSGALLTAPPTARLSDDAGIEVEGRGDSGRHLAVEADGVLKTHVAEGVGDPVGVGVEDPTAPAPELIEVCLVGVDGVPFRHDPRDFRLRLLAGVGIASGSTGKVERPTTHLVHREETTDVVEGAADRLGAVLLLRSLSPG